MTAAGVGRRTSTCRARIGALFGEASAADRGLRKADGVSAARGGRGFCRPPPPPPPPGPGRARNTRRGSVRSTVAVSGAPEVSHRMLTTNVPCARVEASVGRSRRRATNGVPAPVPNMAGGSRVSVVRWRTTCRASIPARTASPASKNAVPGRVLTAPETTTDWIASLGTPAARAISSAVNTSARADIERSADQGKSLASRRRPYSGPIRSPARPCASPQAVKIEIPIVPRDLPQSDPYAFRPSMKR